MMNHSTMTVSGRVTRDPERRVGRETGNDFAVVPIAVNRRKFDRTQNAWVTSGTMYVDLLAFGTTGPTALASFKKGDPVIAHGRVSLNEWRTDTSAGARLVVDVDSIGHDVSFGVSRFSKGWVSYDGDRSDDYDASLTGGIVHEVEARTSARDLTGADRSPAGGVDDELDDGLDDGLDDELGEEPGDGYGAEIVADEDGVVQDDAQAEAVLARSA